MVIILDLQEPHLLVHFRILALNFLHLDTVPPKCNVTLALVSNYAQLKLTKSRHGTLTFHALIRGKKIHD